MTSARDNSKILRIKMVITHETNTARPSQEAMLIAALNVALVPEGLQLNSRFGRSSDSPEPVAFPSG